ncbi:MAG: type I-F CRISPR-associated endoribonuclease Cas6/Csy4 [Spongiibacteraceae bacterium]|nr:type I-F CRISPR-associated endoribonuclease Cas6/Csy4 [Spongiibacteraceae bacterium]
MPDQSRLVTFTVVRHAGQAINATFKRKLARFNRRHDKPKSAQEQKKLKLYLVNKSQALPYFTIKSDKGIYPIYILKRLVNEGKGGDFNSFGLGNQGGVVYDF